MGDSNPIQKLKALFPRIEYAVTEEGPDHAKTFTAKVLIDGVAYSGVARKKKEACKTAAKNALLSIHSQSPDLRGRSRQQPNHERPSRTKPSPQDTSHEPPDLRWSTPQPSSSAKASAESTPHQTRAGDPVFADIVLGLINNAYEKSRMKDVSEGTYKVLAGVIMTTEQDKIVVVLATGSKAIRHLSDEGESIHDCHAEILARRAFKYFLYDQIAKYTSHQPDSIFQKVENSNGHHPPYLELKPGIQFHLYISSAPCGDGRRFTDQKNPEVSYIYEKTPVHGLLCLKVYATPGNPVSSKPVIQIWEEIKKACQPQPIKTMTCSDKVVSWNVTGVQGGLLSNIIMPIYFTNIIISDVYHFGHLERALSERIKNIEGIKDPFFISHPLISKTSFLPVGLHKNSPEVGCCWALGWTIPEKLFTSTGKKTDGRVSSLSKRSFLYRYSSILTSRPDWIPEMQSLVSDGRLHYRDSKLTAQNYQQAKETLHSFFAATKLGYWVKKPVQVEDFFIGIQVPKDNRKQLKEWMKSGDWHKAFQMAISISDPSLAVLACECCNALIFSADPPILTRPEVLDLIKLLSMDLSVSTPLKLEFIQAAIENFDLDVRDVKEELTRVLNTLCDKLQRVSAVLGPSSPANGQLRLLRNTVENILNT